MSVSASLQADHIKVYPPHSVVFDANLAVWGERWWQWMLSIDAGINPVPEESGAHCREGQSGPVFFLAGNFGNKPGERTIRSCSVPCGKHLFLPLVNTVTWIPLDGNTCEELRSALDLVERTVDLLTCEVDGEVLSDLESHRERTAPGCFLFTPIANNVFKDILPAQEQTFASDGYWLMLEPLSPGPHTIRFSAHVLAQDFFLDVTYNLTVEACRFRRGEVNRDDQVDLSDTVALLNRLFLGGSPEECEDAADGNDDGLLDISDPVAVLSFLFLGSGGLAAPGPISCGEDPTSDGLQSCSSERC